MSPHLWVSVPCIVEMYTGTYFMKMFIHVLIHHIFHEEYYIKLGYIFLQTNSLLLQNRSLHYIGFFTDVGLLSPLPYYFRISFLKILPGVVGRSHPGSAQFINLSSTHGRKCMTVQRIRQYKTYGSAKHMVRQNIWWNKMYVGTKYTVIQNTLQ